MGYHSTSLHEQAAAAFSPPSMLDMPFARMEDRRAVQEDAYIVWCDKRDAEAALRATPGWDRFLDRLVGGRRA